VLALAASTRPRPAAEAGQLGIVPRIG
jgi:hypothetical protein